jgi:hypothetical protein
MVYRSYRIDAYISSLLTFFCVQRKPSGPTTTRKPVPKPVNLPSQRKVCSFLILRGDCQSVQVPGSVCAVLML